MPIKSQAQRRKFAELLVTGKISNEVYERWNRGAGGKELPEHVKPKTKAKSKAKKRTSKRKTTAKTRGKTKKRAGSARTATKRATRAR